MSTDLQLVDILEALDDCTAAVEELHTRCCDPGRSPQMIALTKTLAEARAHVEEVGAAPEAGDIALAHFEDAGAQVGRLRVACCAPNRTPLYSRVLEGLGTAHLSLTAALGRGH